MEKETIIVSFSGGETSGMMCKYLLDEWSWAFNFIFIFANTGKETEETLIFADKCDKEFGLNLIWVEAIINPIKNKGVRHKIVNFRTANRDGKPFENLIAKEGIPNTSRPFCTSRLKTRPIRHWMKVNGFIKCCTAIGMRFDEPSRNNPDAANAIEFNLIYPLSHWVEIDKQDVNTFWEDQPFRLNQAAYMGNCVTCYKKTDYKLWRIAHEHPTEFAWCHDMEQRYKHVNADEGDQHLFFRKKRTTATVVGQAMEVDYERLIYMTTSDRDKSAGCGEECQPFTN